MLHTYYMMVGSIQTWLRSNDRSGSSISITMKHDDFAMVLDSHKNANTCAACQVMQLAQASEHKLLVDDTTVVASWDEQGIGMKGAYSAEGIPIMSGGAGLVVRELTTGTELAKVRNPEEARLWDPPREAVRTLKGELGRTRRIAGPRRW